MPKCHPQNLLCVSLRKSSKKCTKLQKHVKYYKNHWFCRILRIFFLYNKVYSARQKKCRPDSPHFILENPPIRPQIDKNTRPIDGMRQNQNISFGNLVSSKKFSTLLDRNEISSILALFLFKNIYS